MRLLLSVIVGLLFLRTTGICAIPTDSIDVFPLHVGKTFQYEYYRFSANWYAGIESRTLDSGLVTYCVIDSETASTKQRRWLIREDAHRVHEHYVESMYDGRHPPDIFQWFDTTSIGLLTEELEGYYRLSARFLVWSFPIRDSAGTDVNGVATIEPTRYAAKTPERLIYSLTNGSPWVVVKDTLIFEAGVGLTYRHWTWSTGAMYKNYAGLSTTLLSSVSDVRLATRPAPEAAELEQNYPNPFNPKTTIRFQLSGATDVSVDVYDVLGVHVANLGSGRCEQGSHELQFDGSPYSSGVYYCRLKTPGITQTKVILLVK